MNSKERIFANGVLFQSLIGLTILSLLSIAPSCPSNSPERYYDYGLHYMAENDFVQAQRYFTQAIKQNPRHFDAYSQRAISWEQSDSMKRAILDYDTLLTFSGLTVEKTANFYYKKGQMNYLLLNDSLCCINWEKACELNHNKSCDLIRKYCKKQKYE